MSFSKALSARVIAGGEGGDPRLRGEGEVGRGARTKNITCLSDTTSPPHCFAMGPFLSPAYALVKALTRRRGTLSEVRAH